MTAPSEWAVVAERNASKAREALVEVSEALADKDYRFAANKARAAATCLSAAAHFSYVARVEARKSES